MYDLIIIGSGPAGLSAAVYGKRAGLNLLIIEEKPMSGGQILNTYEVDNYLGLPGISGFDMGMTFRQHSVQITNSAVSRSFFYYIRTNHGIPVSIFHDTCYFYLFRLLTSNR